MDILNTLFLSFIFLIFRITRRYNKYTKIGREKQAFFIKEEKSRKKKGRKGNFVQGMARYPALKGFFLIFSLLSQRFYGEPDKFG
jgi:hypothetical protein